MGTLPTSLIRPLSNATVTEAQGAISKIYTEFNLPQPSFSPIVEDVVQKYNLDPQGSFSYYFLSDHLGSSSYITNAAGNVSQHMEYLPFGETLVEEHLNSINCFASSLYELGSPFKYNGKAFDGETGNYYYGARYYDPKLSIWLSVDPLAEKFAGRSAYEYGFGNPVRFVDPTGMEPEGGLNDPPGGWLGKAWGSLKSFFGFNNQNNRLSFGTPEYEIINEAAPVVEETTDTGYRVYGYKVKEGIETEYAGANLAISGFSGGYDRIVNEEEISGNASIYGVSASGNARLGTKNNNVAIDAEGSAFKAEIQGAAGLYGGKNGKWGFKLAAEASAAALDGSYTPSITIGGYKIGLTIGASAGSAHIGGRTAAYYDTNTKQGELSALGHIGLGEGVKIGFSISNTSRDFYGFKRN